MPKSSTVHFELGDVANRIGAEVMGDPSVTITGMGTLQNARKGELTHCSSPKYRPYLADTNATAVILDSKDAPYCPTNALIVSNPALSYAQASRLFCDRPRDEEGIHPSSHVNPSVVFGKHVRVGAHALVMRGARLGDYAEIRPGAFIGENVSIGACSLVMPNVVIYSGVQIGTNCTIHANTVIGADGFGFQSDENDKFIEVAQLGTVEIGDDVVVGASSTIDRGAIENTIVESGVKIDDQVHIGHNCKIGKNTLLCGCAGIAGSVTIGKNCVIGGGVGIAGDGPLTIADGVSIGAMTFVSKDIEEAGVYSGTVLHNTNAKWRRNALRFQQLDELAKRIEYLESRWASSNT